MQIYTKLNLAMKCGKIFQLTMLAYFLLNVTPVSAKFNYHSQIGVVIANTVNGLYLIIPNPKVHVGESIVIVDLSSQHAMTAKITKKVPVLPPPLVGKVYSNDSPGSESYYLLMPTGKNKVAATSVNVGIVGFKGTFHAIHGFITADLNGNETAEYFRVCTSSEGLHLTVWTGEPLKGKRMWHTYYYLGFDVEPSCQSKDDEEQK